MIFHIGTLVRSGKCLFFLLFFSKSFVLRRQLPLLVRFNEEENGFLCSLCLTATKFTVGFRARKQWGKRPIILFLRSAMETAKRRNDESFAIGKIKSRRGGNKNVYTYTDNLGGIER